ncbi:hypothetical protein FX988_04286 (plasmid) [Paraglaciecola mesophila]|uniref:Peptidase S8/S53 domain-containing protein n=1 Tax=Paraglaciecola mesophila TaxID=197222 RepID=A0A857JTE4_9ALTE|nr:S8 family serine peptidase [Paraglaciecola mesophila]QHJ14004.1 hypothetical protein FX988_04286 [Paraglaciecola mesophila]
MLNFRQKTLSIILPFIFLNFSYASETDFLPKNTVIINTKSHSFQNKVYTYYKLRDELTGKLDLFVADVNGRKIEEYRSLHNEVPFLGLELQKRLNLLSIKGSGELIEVELLLNRGEDTLDIKKSDKLYGKFDLNNNIYEIYENDVLVKKEKHSLKLRQKQRNQKEKANKKHQNKIKAAKTLFARYEWLNEQSIYEQLSQSKSSLLVTLTPLQIALIASEKPSELKAIELAVKSKTLTADAMIDTGVDPYALSTYGTRGEGIGIYMTEDYCPDPNHITNYTRLGGSTNSHSEFTAGILRDVSPESYIYCDVTFKMPSVATLTGFNGNPSISIVSNAWGNVTTATGYTSADRNWDNFVYDNRVSTFFAAGNGGNNATVNASTRGFNVITVGAYNNANNAIASFSNGGDPSTGNIKPEIVAPGVGISAGGYSNQNGTSASAPFAAAFAANVMSWPFVGPQEVYMPSAPAVVKAVMIAASDINISGNADAIEEGAASFRSANERIQMHFWEGSYSNFFWGPRGSVRRFRKQETVFFADGSLSEIRVALSWLEDGDYIYDHRNDALSITRDFDLDVYSPSGILVASSTNFNNTFESITFTPTEVGNYRAVIDMLPVNNSYSPLIMGLAWSYSN